MSVSHVVLSFGHVGHVGHDRNKMTLEDLLTPPVLSLEDPKYKALIERCTREAGAAGLWKLNMTSPSAKCQKFRPLFVNFMLPRKHHGNQPLYSILF